MAHKNIATRSNNQDDWNRYREARNRVTTNVRKDKRKHLNNLFDNVEASTDTTLFRITREKLGWKSGGPPSALRTNEELLTKPRDIAECMSKYFENKITTLKSKIPMRTKDPLEVLMSAMNKWPGSANRPELELREVTLIEVIKIINELRNSTTMGHNELDPMTLKLVTKTIAKPIQHILNVSIRTQTFVNTWKLGKLIPLFKGGVEDKLESQGYRPISILPLISKILERAIQSQIMEFMETTKQWNKNLHAYRSLHSTTTAALQLTEYTMDAADKGLVPNVMYIDQSAVFDCMEADILDRKLQVYKFSDNTRRWIYSYMT